MPIRRQRHRPSERDLAALADGSLPPARRERLERAVAQSPELQAQLRDQRHALDAVRAANEVRAPAALRTRVAHAGRPSRARARLAPGLGGAVAHRPGRPLPTQVLAAPATAVPATAAVLLAGGGDGHGPTVADAAALGARPATATASEERHGPATLERPVAAGLRFPYWGDRFGWKAIGVRYDRLAGRPATTVFYRRRAEVVSYTIVGGSALPAAHRSMFRGRTAVTWLRRGHSCVLSGTRTSRTALLRLAAWRGGGDIAF
jgi:anti-sigma factor RsiW